MIDLKAKPFFLDEEAIRWVSDTLSAVTAVIVLLASRRSLIADPPQPA